MAEQDDIIVCQFCHKGSDVHEVLNKNNTYVHLACMVQCRVPQLGVNKGLISPNRRLKEVEEVLKTIKSKKCEVCNKNGAGIKCCSEECEQFMHLPCTPLVQSSENNFRLLEDEESDYKFYCRKCSPGTVKIENDLNNEDGDFLLENKPRVAPHTVEHEANTDLKEPTEKLGRKLQEMQIVENVTSDQIPKSCTPFILTEEIIKKQRGGTEQSCHISAGLHYQALVMLDVILELRLLDYKHTATFEKRHTGAFDDVCVEYSRTGQVGDEGTVKLFIQVKHGSRRPPEPIKFSKMFEQIETLEDYEKKKLDKNFHQLKYFNSFYNHPELQEKNSKIVIFTNRKFEANVSNFDTKIVPNFIETVEELKDLNIKAHKFDIKSVLQYLMKIGINKDQDDIYRKAQEYLKSVLFVTGQPDYSRIVTERIIPKIKRDWLRKNLLASGCIRVNNPQISQAYDSLFTWVTSWFDSITNDRKNSKEHTEIDQKFSEIYSQLRCNVQ